MTKTIFFGSSPYSLIILESLLQLPDFPLLAIVTKPNMPVGRQQIITKNPVAQFVHDHQLPLLQPTDFDSEFIEKLRSLQPDLILVVAYGPPYFTETMIDIPTYKIVNIHPSPLPRYRGATPGPWQIINGETKSAVTFFQIDAFPDHGPLIAQIPFDISPTEISDSFYEKAFSLGAQNLSSVLSSYIKNPQKLTPQNHSQKSYFPKFTKDSAKIDWSWDKIKLERFIRALNPWPIAWTYVQNQQSQKLSMKIFGFNTEPTEVQIEGKNKTLWSEISKYYQIIK